jgi:hypothetical protein
VVLERFARSALDEVDRRHRALLALFEREVRLVVQSTGSARQNTSNLLDYGHQCVQSSCQY